MVAEAVSALPADTPMWNADMLIERLDALCLRFSLPALDPDTLAIRSELKTLIGAGMADTAYLACLCAAVARCTCGPLMAYGPWAGSALLAHCRAVLGPDPDDPDNLAEPTSVEHGAFLARIEAGEATQPAFLAPVVPDLAFVDALGAELASMDLALAPLPGPAGALTLALGANPLSPEAHAAVAVLPSLLWGAAHALSELVHRIAGLSRDAIVRQDASPEAGLLLASPFGAALPELPTWATALPAAQSLAALQDAWIGACPAAPPDHAAQALRCRAALAWHFASLGAHDPALAWLALATILDPARRAGVLHAAASAGMPIPPAPDAGESTDDRQLVIAEWLAAHHLGAGVEPETSQIPPEAAVSPALPPPERPTRTVSYGGAELHLYAVNPGLEAGAPQLWVADAADPGTAPPDGIACSVDGLAIRVAPALAASAPLSRLQVLVALSGDRDQDLHALDRLEALLRDHPGPLPIRVVLERGNARRELERPNAAGVAWSADLVAALEAAAGTGNVTLREASVS